MGSFLMFLQKIIHQTAAIVGDASVHSATTVRLLRIDAIITFSY
jgi:hypothetical protein